MESPRDGTRATHRGRATAVIWANAGCKHAEATDADDARQLRGPGLRRSRPVRMRTAETANGHLSPPLPLRKTMLQLIMARPTVSPRPASDPRNSKNHQGHRSEQSKKPETVAIFGKASMECQEAFKQRVRHNTGKHDAIRAPEKARSHKAKCTSHTQHSSADSSNPSCLTYSVAPVSVWGRFGV